MKIIINADDFGYSNEINNNIKNAIEKNVITSSTIIANAPFFDEAISIAKKHRTISYGVHLNLIEFEPLSDSKVFKKYDLIDQNGAFKYSAVFNIKKFPSDLKKAIKNEWEMQIMKVVGTGIEISHLDSHQHTHTIPQIEDVVIELLKEFGVTKIRKRVYWSIPLILRVRKYKAPVYSMKKESSHSNRCTSFFCKILNHLLFLPVRHAKWMFKMKKNAKMPDFLFSYQVFIQEYSKHKRKYDNRVIEIECHPGLLENSEETKWLFEDRLSEYSKYHELISYDKL